MIFGLIENIKGISYPLIKLEFSASWEQQGFMVSILSMAYVSFCIIAGLFLGRFGIKPSFLFGFAALGIGLLSVFFMPGFYSTIASLFIIFAGFGFFEVGLNALASRLFIAKTAMLMNLLHSFYGIGAILGPKAAGIIANNEKFSWRHVYLFSLPLALLFFITSVFSRFPEKKLPPGGKDKTTAARPGFFDALRSPMVWLFAVILGLAVIVEMNSANWGPLYFKDVYGFDPGTKGAGFLSAFFLVFTVSRLVCGPFVEKIGYIRTLLIVSVSTLVVFITGFFIGANGIYILPALGFFIALLWPTIMATAVVTFGENAAVYSSAIIAMSGLINAAVQFLIGITNKILGPAWGYRSSMVYTLLLILMIMILHHKLKNTKTYSGNLSHMNANRLPD